MKVSRLQYNLELLSADHMHDYLTTTANTNIEILGDPWSKRKTTFKRSPVLLNTALNTTTSTTLK